MVHPGSFSVMMLCSVQKKMICWTKMIYWTHSEEIPSSSCLLCDKEVHIMFNGVVFPDQAQQHWKVVSPDQAHRSKHRRFFRDFLRGKNVLDYVNQLGVIVESIKDMGVIVESAGAGGDR